MPLWNSEANVMPKTLITKCMFSLFILTWTAPNINYQRHGKHFEGSRLSIQVCIPSAHPRQLPDVMILPSGPRTLRRRSGVTTGVPPLHTVPDATVNALAALAAVTTATETVETTATETAETTVIAKGEGGVGLQNVDAANPQIAGGKDVMIGEVIEIGRGIGRGPRLLQMTLKKRPRLQGIGHRRRLMSTDC